MATTERPVYCTESAVTDIGSHPDSDIILALSLHLSTLALSSLKSETVINAPASQNYGHKGKEGARAVHSAGDLVSSKSPRDSCSLVATLASGLLSPALTGTAFY